MSADLLSGLKNELLSYYKDKSSAWSGSMSANRFHSTSMADPAKVNTEAAGLMQEAAIKPGGNTFELVVPGSLAYVMMSSCRSEKLAEMTRIQCMAAVLNESETMQAMVVNKLDGLK